MLARVKVLNSAIVILLVLVLAPGASAARTRLVVTTTDSADDPSNPAHPLFSPADSENIELVGHIGGVTRAVAVQGNYAYIGEGPRLTVLDISNPALPTVVGKTPLLPDVVRGVAVAGDYAYVADWDAGLRVVDVSDLAHPTEVGYYDTPGSAEDVAVAGGYAYVADEDAGLRVIDVGDPAHPTEVGYYDTPGHAWDVVVAGHYAYVADDDGLRIIDVSDPTMPTEAGFHDTPWKAIGVAVTDNYIYVADGYSGLRIIDVSSPTAPNEIGFYDTPGYANSVAVDGNYAYVADGRGGLVILRLLRDKVTGSIPTTGGSLSSTSGDTSLVFPSGAFTGTVALTYRHLWSDENTGALAGIGHTFDLTAIYLDTGQPAHLAPGTIYTAIITYTTSGPVIENTLGLYWWDEGASRWSQQGITSSVNVTDNVVTAQVDHFSLFAVLGETHRVYLPLVLRGY